jgi:hypothetical protein
MERSVMVLVLSPWVELSCELRLTSAKSASPSELYVDFRKLAEV